MYGDSIVTDSHVFLDHVEDVLLQHGQVVGTFAPGALMRNKDLQAVFSYLG